MLSVRRVTLTGIFVLGCSALGASSDGLLGASNRFTENRGQWDPRAQFMSRTRGVKVWVTDSGVVYDFVGKGGNGHVVRMDVVGARPTQSIGVGPLAGRLNYFIGNQDDWVTGVRSFREARTENALPGISTRWYVQNGSPRYDFIVAPGADPGSIGLRFTGAQALRAEGSTVTLGTSLGPVRHTDLRAYQTYGRRIHPVPCVVQLDRTGTVRFRVGRYDPLRPLVIDPLVWGTFLGGTSSEEAVDAAIGHSGDDILIGGTTTSESFPVSEGAYSIVKADSVQVAFVAKLSADGSTLDFATYLGGEGQTTGKAVAVDALGRVVVVGTTFSKLFPTTPGALDRRLNTGGTGPGDGFVSLLSSDGSSLLMSTFLGGAANEQVSDLEVQGSDLLIGGFTTSGDFKATAGAFGAGSIPSGSAAHGFATKLAPGGTSVVFRALFKKGNLKAVGFDGGGSVYVAGNTSDTAFPTTAGAWSTTLRGSADGFLCKLDPTGSSLVYSTFVGGDFSDSIADIALRGGEAVVVGQQGGNFPAGTANSGGYVLGVNSAGSALSFGRSIKAFTAFQVALNQDGEIFTVGESGGIGLPVSQTGFDREFQGIRDGAVLRFNPDGSSVQYGTYLNGGANTSFYVTLNHFAEGNSSLAPEQWLLRYGDPQGSLESTPYMAHTVDGAVVQANLNALATIPDNGVTVLGPVYDPVENRRTHAIHFVGVPAANVQDLLVHVKPDNFVLDSIATADVLRLNGSTSSQTACMGVAVDSLGDVVVCGKTDSGSVPGTLGSFSPLSSGGGDAFVAKFDTRPLFPASVSGVGGDSGIGGFLKGIKVTLNRAAPADVPVAFSTTFGGALRPPPTITIPSGETSATVNIITRTVTSDTPSTLFANYNGGTATCVITLKPGGLLAHSGALSSVQDDSTFTGFVTLSGPAPANGRSVDLVETSPVVTVPSPVPIAAGETVGNYTGTTGTVLFTSVNVTITARLGSMSVARTIKVNP